MQTLKLASQHYAFIPFDFGAHRLSRRFTFYLLEIESVLEQSQYLHTVEQLYLYVITEILPIHSVVNMIRSAINLLRKVKENTRVISKV